MKLPVIGKLVELQLKNGIIVVAMRNSYDEDGAIFEDVDCIDHHEKDVVSWKYIQCIDNFKMT